jgi:hypothetical protein
MINPRLAVVAISLVLAYAGVTELGEHHALLGIAFLALALLVAKTALRTGIRR